MRPALLAAALLAGLPLAALPSGASAHGPSRQKVSESVAIAAPPAKVWARIGHFGAMDWHPAVFSTEAQGGDAVDATRRLTLGAAGGGVIDEVLTKFSPDKRSYAYRITAVDVAVLPVTNYSSNLTVKDGPDGGALVEWNGAFYRGYPNNDPPAHLNDDAAIAAVRAVYRAGLDALKAEMEASN